MLVDARVGLWNTSRNVVGLSAAYPDEGEDIARDVGIVTVGLTGSRRTIAFLSPSLVATSPAECCSCGEFGRGAPR